MFAKRLLALAIAASLSACGGSGDSPSGLLNDAGNITTAPVPNRAPVAVIDTLENAIVGDSVFFSAARSYDNDTDDAITAVRWQLVSGPADSKATLSSESDTEVTLVPDVAGDYVVGLSVSDGEDDSELTTVRLPVMGCKLLQFL